jgi:mono/diheme cytochrome c family protein
MLVHCLGLVCVIVLGFSNADAADVTSSAESKIQPDYKRDVLPVLEKHCLKCHGQENQEGGIRLEGLSQDLITDRRAAETWHEVLNVVSAGEMPPEDSPTMTEAEIHMLTQWISGKIKQAIESRQQTDGRVILRKMNRQEYQNTMTDLLGLEMDYVRDLPPDAVSSDGFNNDGQALRMSAFQLECYLDAARRAMDRVLKSGEAPEIFRHEFAESRNDKWISTAVKSNRLGRQQEFLAKMKEYPDEGEFIVTVKVAAELIPDGGLPLLEVSVGYCPDTQILVREFEPIEVSEPDVQVYEFRGQLEDFPLPVRGQGKYPGLVIRVRNVYDDGSELPKEQKDEQKKKYYPDEPHLPKLLIQSVQFEGPVFEQWPPASHQQIVFESPLQNVDDMAYVREVLSKFMTKAFRRPVGDDELQRFADHYDFIRPDFPSQLEALRETLALVLIQPEFLYLVEPAGDKKRSVNGWELASRLSYFLWSTMPDARLLELAASGNLLKDDVLSAEVQRMLSDQRASRFTVQFTDQWLQLDRIESVAVDAKRYPDFDDSLKSAFRQQTHALFAKTLHENESIFQLIDAEVIMLNERLARHYGIPGVMGTGMRPVPRMPEDHRGGLLTHGSILLSNSTGSDSHPIRRAVWIRDRILNDPPAPPPPDVPTLEDGDPDFRKRSILEQLAIHRKKAACNNCHKNLDPWGIALEGFDAVGLHRKPNQTQAAENKTIPTTTNRLPGGVELADVQSLKRHLLESRKDDFSRSLVIHLLTYALGRPIQLTDQNAVHELTASLEADNYQLRNLITQVVLSPSFRTK